MMWTALLHNDPLLLDYFNKFLSSEAFIIQFSYDIGQKDFVIVSPIPSLEVDEMFQSKLFHWIEEQRFKLFIKSRVYHTYELHQLVLKECDKASLHSTSLPSTPLPSTRLHSPHLSSPPLTSTHLPSTPLPSTRLPSPPLPSTHLTSPPLPSTHLPSTHLPSPPLPSTHLTSTHLPSAPLSSTHLTSPPLPSTHLPSTHLPSPPLPSTHLPSTHLPSPPLPSTHLTSTHLPSAPLPSTHLTSTHLTSTSPPSSPLPSTSLPSIPIPSSALHSTKLPQTRALSIVKLVEVSDLRSSQLPTIPSVIGPRQVTKSMGCPNYGQNKSAWDPTGIDKLHQVNGSLSPPSLGYLLNLNDMSEVLDKAEGMDQFCKFLVTTKGRDLIDVWLDVRELEELQSGLDLQELISSSASVNSPRSSQSFSHSLSYKHLKTHLELKYSHMLVVEGSGRRRTLEEAKSVAFHKLNGYWLPRYVMQVRSHHSVGNTFHLPELATISSDPHLLAAVNSEGKCEPANEFSLGLRAESSAGRPLMKYFMRNGMFGLARMLLFWQSVEELRLLEEKGVEDSTRDRLSWNIYKEFIAEGGDHSLPVSNKDCSQIVVNLRQGYMTTRLTAFESLPTLCLSSLKRAWSCYLRSNYEAFVCEVGKTPVLPSHQPAPLSKPESAKSLRKSGGKKKKKKKKKKGKGGKRGDVAQLASYAYIEEALSRVPSLDKVRSSGMIHNSRLSRVSRTSRNSTRILSQVLPTSDPLSNYMDDCQNPLHPKLVAFISYLKNSDPKSDSFLELRNLEFCLEVNKLKAIVFAQTDIAIVQSKVEALVDNYLDLVRPPWLLVSIPSNLVLRIVETVSQHTDGLISQPSSAMIDSELELLEWAKQVVLATLIPAWGDFLVKWHNNSKVESKNKGQRAGCDHCTSPSSSLPSVTSVPLDVPPVEKMKITYSLTTGAFWANSPEMSSRLRTRTDLQ